MWTVDHPPLRSLSGDDFWTTLTWHLRGATTKSMTALADHTQWQDVYHVPWGDLLLYVKFTDDLITEFLLLSFKEK